jgi:hypothetical protein
MVDNTDALLTGVIIGNTANNLLENRAQKEQMEQELREETGDDDFPFYLQRWSLYKATIWHFIICIPLAFILLSPVIKGFQNLFFFVYIVAGVSLVIWDGVKLWWRRRYRFGGKIVGFILFWIYFKVFGTIGFLWPLWLLFAVVRLITIKKKYKDTPLSDSFNFKFVKKVV